MLYLLCLIANWLVLHIFAASIHLTLFILREILTGKGNNKKKVFLFNFAYFIIIIIILLYIFFYDFFFFFALLICFYSLINKLVILRNNEPFVFPKVIFWSNEGSPC